MTLKGDGSAFTGRLYQYDTGGVVLHRAEDFGSSTEHVPVDGEVYLRWSKVAYVSFPVMSHGWSHRDGRGVNE